MCRNRVGHIRCVEGSSGSVLIILSHDRYAVDEISKVATTRGENRPEEVALIKGRNGLIDISSRSYDGRPAIESVANNVASIDPITQITSGKTTKA